MSIQVELKHLENFSLPLDQENCFKQLSDFQNSIGKNFPGLESFLETGPGVYTWAFSSVRTGGYDIQILFSTRFILFPFQKIEIESVPGEGNSQLSGYWNLQPLGPSQTKVTLDIKMTAELPLPFFVRPIANSLIQTKIGQYFESYAANVVKSFA